MLDTKVARPMLYARQMPFAPCRMGVSDHKNIGLLSLGLCLGLLFL